MSIPCYITIFEQGSYVPLLSNQILPNMELTSDWGSCLPPVVHVSVAAPLAVVVVIAVVDVIIISPKAWIEPKLLASQDQERKTK